MESEVCISESMNFLFFCKIQFFFKFSLLRLVLIGLHHLYEVILFYVLYTSGFQSVRRASPGGRQRAAGEAQREKKITRNREI